MNRDLLPSTEDVHDTLPADDLPLDLPPEAIFERLSSGAAAREKLERLEAAKLPHSFYFVTGALVGDHRNGPTPMRLTGCEHRLAKSGPRVGRFVIPIPGTERTVVVTPEEIQAFEKCRTALRLKELRSLRKLRRARAPAGAAAKGQ